MSRRYNGLDFNRKPQTKISGEHIRELISWLFWIVISAVIAFVLMYVYGFRTNVIGNSMEPGLYSGQQILIDRLTYNVSMPKRGDVVAFVPNGNEDTHISVKRIIGLPGEKVMIKDGYVYIDGVLLDEAGAYDRYELKLGKKNIENKEMSDKILADLDGADYIVRAKNVGHEPSYRDEEGTDRHIYTDYIFEILESFKGDRVVGDKVTVKWYGGELDGEKSVVAGETPINEGQEYILILSHETDENDVPTENDKYMFYPPRGILADDGTGVFTARDPAISFTADGFRAEVEKILG